MGIKQYATAALLSAALLGAAGASAQTGQVVTLKSFDGFTQLRGELVQFDGSAYTIRTGLGVIQVDALQVTCEGEACPSSLLYGSEFGIHGSNTIGDALMPALIEGYAEQLDADALRELTNTENERIIRVIHDNGREMAAIDLRAHGSGTSYPSLADGSASIGMSSRRMKDSEAQLLTAAGYGDLRDTPNEHVVALDGLIVFVHPNNPISALSLEQMARIFAGDITNWSEVGGPDLPITVYARDPKSGTWDTFESLVLDPFGVPISPAALRFEDSAALSDSVANDRSGIGFAGFAYARAAKVLAIRQTCGLLSAPTTFAVKTEEYPLARRLYLYDVPGEKPAHVRELLQFAVSPEAAPFIQDAGFISLNPEGQSLDSQGQRIVYALTGEEEFSLPMMREMLTELRSAERLSTTFRFQPGSSRLDAISERGAGTLADAIEAGEFDGKEILLVGFTDSIGQFELNRSLGLRRAQEVVAALTEEVDPAALSRVPVSALGYGELTPVGCNDSFEGRLANRRVEVWVREASIN